jgi:hypothetical protein
MLSKAINDKKSAGHLSMNEYQLDRRVCQINIHSVGIKRRNFFWDDN